VSHPNRLDIVLFSSLSPAPTPECPQRFGPELIRGDYEYRLGYGITHVYDTKEAASSGLPKSDASPVSAGTIFPRSSEYVLDFLFRYVVLVHVRKPGLRIDVIANVHTGMLASVISAANVSET